MHMCVMCHLDPAGWDSWNRSRDNLIQLILTQNVILLPMATFLAKGGKTLKALKAHNEAQIALKMHCPIAMSAN